LLFARLLVLFTDPHPGFHHDPREQSLSSFHITQLSFPNWTPLWLHPPLTADGSCHSWVELHGLFQLGVDGFHLSVYRRT